MMSSDRPHDPHTIFEDIPCRTDRVKSNHTWTLPTFHVSEKHAESFKGTNRSTEELGRVIEGLRWIATVFGLLPWGAASPQNSCKCFMKIASHVIILLVVSISYAVFESCLLPHSKFASRTTYFVTEVLFEICLSITSWIILISFMARHRKLVKLLDSFHHLEVQHFGTWSLVAQVSLVVIPIVIDYVIFTLWNIEFKLSLLQASWLYPIYLFSFFWLLFLPVVPLILYTVLGSLILNFLICNNNDLVRILGDDSKASSLLEIRQKSLEIRRLYSELGEILSVPLLCCEIFITCTLINTAFVIILTSKMYFSMANYLNIVSNILQLMTVAMIGRTSDNIKNAAAAPLVLLAEFGLVKNRNEAPPLTWPEVPQQVVIYHLAERPMNFCLGGLYNLSLQNILSMMAATSTYLVVFLQFDEDISGTA